MMLNVRRANFNWRSQKVVIFPLVLIFVLCSKDGHCWSSSAYSGYGKQGSVKDRLLKSYDFVIVGGGNAGAVLANRLSEIPQWNILLIEAGGRDNVLSDVPLFAAYLQSTALNWNFRAEKQNGYCEGIENFRCAMPKGKGLGGSTIINYMIYNRGNPADFDDWESAGNEGWSYREVLPYFKKLENAAFKDTNQTPIRGKKGPVNVEYVPYRSALVHAFVEANKQLGRNIVDYNGDTQIGVDYLQATTNHGRRVTSASAYLNSVSSRPNLHILTNARATAVTINPHTKTATGIEYLWQKRKHTVRVRKEVILSAGAFQSPQLLMLSGIGPKQHLEELGIQVLVDSPVGKTMHDHLALIALTFLTNTTKESFDTDRLGVPEMIAYLKRGNGTLTVPGALEALAFIKSNISNEVRDIPDLELLFVGGSPASDHGTGAVRGSAWQQDIYDRVYKPHEGEDQFTIAVMLFHPKSKGYIRLKDSNPLHWPLIYSNLLNDEEDITMMIEGIKEAFRIIDTPVMKAIDARIIDTALPTCTQHSFGTDPYWKCLIRSLASTLHHQVSTCRMGPANDPEAVVSPKLRVYGIKRLRVVDASVIPSTITGHTQAAVYMIAEKASDMIKDHWNWGQKLNMDE
ncbi:glucose dehydrogenase [FAD, quinone]-like [Topomyia yanbarensis]|uniref:glucose dehydrogenase [FAD, quinone]-like n=1 Tax=Topomyia yanbarensis TaxID=2498891 RepID=UPI00273CDCC7|nr:glucose dehydrogenase [FAD, quinone]-like [Topomyia yanbarensis]